MKNDVMICIPIMAATNAEMRAQLAAAAEPADLYELRLDRLEEEADIHGLAAAADRPLVATCRSQGQGGYFHGSREQRRDVLQRAIDAGVRYVDAEEDVIEGLRRRHGVVVMASWHDFSATPESLSRIVRRLEALPCDWVKFAVMAKNPADNLTVLEALASGRKPAVGIAMGEIGLPSRILAPAHGSRITFGSLSEGFESAPGQPTARDLAGVYRVRHVDRSTALFGLLGCPVGQSLGYRLHNAGFIRHGLDAVYIPFQAPEAEGFLGTLPERLGLRGLSVTMPHKRRAFAWATDAADRARTLASANTLSRRNGGWLADNTDVSGAAGAVEAKAREIGLSLSGESALVLGSGGTAGSVGMALSTLGCRISVAGRSRDRTYALARGMGWHAVPWEERGNGRWRVVANATSVGMVPAEGATPFPSGSWERGMLAFDAVYRPRVTRFLREASEAGAWTVDGLAMFCRQAAGQFESWTGLPLPEECARAVPEMV